MSDPNVDISRLREHVAGLDQLLRHHAKQLVVAAHNFDTLTKVLTELIKQGKAHTAGIMGLCSTIETQQAQIEGIALIQRTSSPTAVVQKLIGYSSDVQLP